MDLAGGCPCAGTGVLRDSACCQWFPDGPSQALSEGPRLVRQCKVWRDSIVAMEVKYGRDAKDSAKTRISEKFRSSIGWL